ncbi:MAG TPA: fatty acid desaturase [Gammaproteobacteria bacterium]|nr:fatty acid desaturase [Gammaproteobacteria bacterium]
MLDFLNTWLYGLVPLPWWGYVIWTLVWAHVTLMAITLYFHREQAHRSVDLHPALRHFFRFWLWISTGASTRQWVAVHRKHHALCEREGDPHSPVVYGLKRVVLEGAELYMDEARKPETLEKYGKGTPNDWLERNVYNRFDYTGIGLLVVFDVLMFGAAGIIMVAVQLATMPVLAAGIINGVCHAKGYRNFETNDASTNLWRLGLVIGGEELHNNHHAFPTSARFSLRPGEVDMGWLHLKLFSTLGLARIRRVASEPDLGTTSPVPDLEALRSVMINRMHVLRAYMHGVTLPVLRRECEALGSNAKSLVPKVRRWLTWHPQLLDESERRRLGELVDQLPSFDLVLKFRNELKALWEGAHTSNERLLEDFRQWCRRAEDSGNQYLREFAAYLRSFKPSPAQV